jgi:hypothetical protein
VAPSGNVRVILLESGAASAMPSLLSQSLHTKQVR